ncbi:MAG: hypothetical protein WCG10_07340 [Chlamydiota bacterium]
MTKDEPKDSKAGEIPLEIRKAEKKDDLVIIKMDRSSPIQEVMCRQEHKNLFENLYKEK